MPEKNKTAKIDANASARARLNAKGKLKADYYEDSLRLLQIELLKLQKSVAERKNRLIVIFEGSDLAGKSGAIKALSERLDTSSMRVVWQKSSQKTGGKWFLSYYASKLPRAGEITIFDRGWYRKATLERAVGACSSEEYERYIHQIPLFEHMIAEEGFITFKYLLTIGKEELGARLEKQKNDALGRMRLSELELRSPKLYDEYAKAEAETLSRTHSPRAPWFIVSGEDKRLARLGALSHLLGEIDYKDKDRKALGDFGAIARSYTPKVKF
jgi:polyphosphate kinase 2 (PPK2 family)